MLPNFASARGARNVGLLSIGAYRPDRVVTNAEICEQIESSDEWIYTRTGIKTRRFAAAHETAGSMAIEAGRKAVANALLSGSDIGAVIVATNTHMLQTPACAGLVADELGAKGVPAFDVTVGCAGFGYALALAADMIRGGSASTVLVVGSEKLSRTLDMTDRGNCFIFGDGAGAVVVGETPRQQIGPTVWGADGSQFDAIRQDVDWITFLDGDRVQRPYLRIQGTSVFRWAAFEMGSVAQRALEAANVGPQEIDVFVPHQANSRINDLLARSIGMRDGVPVANDIETTGNTSAASIPLAMEHLLSTGESKPGDVALLLGFGAGLSYASQVVAMPPVPVA